MIWPSQCRQGSHSSVSALSLNPHACRSLQAELISRTQLAARSPLVIWIADDPEDASCSLVRITAPAMRECMLQTMFAMARQAECCMPAGHCRQS